MTEVYIIRNQHQLYLDKHGAWVDGGDSPQLFRTRFRDEAINTKVELSVRHPDLRLALVSGVLDERGQLCLASAPGCDIDPAANASFSSSDNPRMDTSADDPSSASATETCS